MGYDLVITARALNEIEDASDYYYKIEPKLESRFLTELTSVYKKFISHSELYSFVLTSRKAAIRDTRLRSFPYLVIFEIRENNVLIILVQHMHQKPLFE